MMDINVKKVGEFELNERVDGYFVIKQAECRTSTNNKKYLDFTIGDKTGEVNAKYWNYQEGDELVYQSNTLVKVRGLVTSWQNNMQFKIEKLRIVKEEDNVNVEDYVASAPIPADEMYIKILEYLSKINNSDIRNIVEVILDGYSDKIMHYPAAKKNHHAIRSGLLYHTLTMLQGGEKLSEIYTFLNKDLLYAGIILHDLAKIEEMNSSEMGIVSEYTVEGQLLGHIVQGIKNIEMAAEKVKADDEIKMLLQHMVLSHHYEAEYGSPKKPMIPEAQMLHFLDIIDASMYDMKKALSETKKGELSESIFSLERRRVYNANLD